MTDYGGFIRKKRSASAAAIYAAAMLSERPLRAAFTPAEAEATAFSTRFASELTLVFLMFFTELSL